MLPPAERITIGHKYAKDSKEDIAAKKTIFFKNNRKGLSCQ